MSQEGVKILVSTAAVLVSLSLASAAFLQLRTARQKLALDLYDRRLEYYRRVHRFLLESMSADGSSHHQHLMSFAHDVDEAHFFFGGDVRQFLDRLYFHALSAISLNERLYPRSRSAGLEVGPERESVSASFSKEQQWFSDQLQEAKVMFAPYMSLGAATVPQWPGFRGRERRRIRKSWEHAKSEVSLTGSLRPPRS